MDKVNDYEIGLLLDSDLFRKFIKNYIARSNCFGDTYNESARMEAYYLGRQSVIREIINDLKRSDKNRTAELVKEVFIDG